MTYRIEISPTAITDIEDIILFTVRESNQQDSQGIVQIHRVLRSSQ
jgi:plasmid stabilization system protein ParE